MKRKEKINKKISLSKKINRGYWITILLITLTGLLVGLRIYGHYMYTSVWEKGEETKIADEEAYMLYLTPKERQTLKSYTKFEKKAILLILLIMKILKNYLMNIILCLTI